MNASFWSESAETLLEVLNSSPQGLSGQQAAILLRTSGRNKKPDSPWLKDVRLLLAQFKSPLMLLLIGAVVLSALLGDTSDVFIILFILLSTGLLGFFQERNAGKVVEHLQSLITLKCRVMREGQEQLIPSEEIVPGDILLLKAGDVVPADCLLLEANELQTNEASLTGESYPVKKETGPLPIHTELSKRNNALWEGSSVVSGKAKAVVVATGTHTVFGQITDSAATDTETSFEKDIRSFGYFLMKISLTLCAFVLAINLLNHKDAFQSALFALALAVGMAPELLPAITTLAMSAGARRMLEKKVIIRKLPSIHNLGEINLLCTDKTGTITEGVIRINSILNAAGTADLFVAELAYWNAHLQTGYENPIDDALRQISLLPTFHPRRLAEIPYDFNRKRLSVLFENAGQKWMVTKGAFDQILAACTHLYIAPEQTLPLDPNAIASLRSQYDDFGTQGLRVIALCYKNTEQAVIIKEDERDMVFAGFILLQDPVKKGISDTIAALGRLQIDLKIITGDNQNVARAIALQLGIENPVVLTGEALQSLTEDRLEETVQGVHIFAAIEPQVKEQIVKILRRKNVVAYIGDGINDVSALHAADVGISVSNAVDVAREVADFVLMEKDLSVLIDGVKEGRKTFANTLKYIYINTGSTFGNMFSVAFASLWLPFLPMLPKQILLTNFITDFPYLSVSGDQVDEEQMQRPGRWNLKLLRNYMLLFGTHSSLFDMLTFLFLYYYMKANESAFQTGWFIESILTELFILFVIRTRKNFFKSTPGRLLVFLSLLGVAITLILPYTPLGPQVGLVPLPGFALLLLLAITATYLLTADLLKVWFFKKFDPQ